ASYTLESEIVLGSALRVGVCRSRSACSAAIAYTDPLPEATVTAVTFPCCEGDAAAIGVTLSGLCNRSTPGIAGTGAAPPPACVFEANCPTPEFAGDTGGRPCRTHSFQELCMVSRLSKP